VRVLVHTRFHPSVGGIETVASILAHEWTRKGAIVSIVTDVARSDDDKKVFPFSVYHRPKATLFLRLLQEHDVFIHFNISLRALWPLLFVRRPFVAAHQGYYIINRSGKRDWRERLKLGISRRAAANIAASTAVARAIEINCEVIPNPYNCSLFRRDESVEKDRDLIFVGRLVSDKGAALLLHALAKLKAKAITPNLTLVGGGPERRALSNLVHQTGLGNQVTFTGEQTQKEIAELLRRHQLLVLPSIYEEPFGIVVLEGAACGCVVIGSDGGGLPEAIGPCGITFRRGDVDDLTAKLSHLLRHRENWEHYQKSAQAHLELHQPSRVASQYLEIFEGVLRGSHCAV
jgi:glycogen(starch) synthase